MLDLEDLVSMAPSDLMTRWRPGELDAKTATDLDAIDAALWWSEVHPTAWAAPGGEAQTDRAPEAAPAETQPMLMEVHHEHDRKRERKRRRAGR